MLVKNKDYFALSFSDHRLRFALAAPGNKLKAYSELALDPGIIERGEIIDREKLSQAVSQLLAKMKIRHRFVVVGIPEIKSFTRTFILPRLETEELDDAVRWESEPLLPFPLAKAYLDWMILEKNDEMVRILVVALPKNIVNGYADVLEKLGFQPTAFETTSLSLARIIGPSKASTLVLDFGLKESVLVIVGPKGGIEVSSTVTHTDTQEAVDEVSSTIAHILSYYRKKAGEQGNLTDVNRVVFCGEGLKIDFVKRIANETKLKVALVTKDEKGMALAAITSLANKDVAAPVDEKTINLIPLSIQGVYDRNAAVEQVSMSIKISLLAMLLVCFGYGVSAARVYFETKKLEGEIIDLQAGMGLSTKMMESQARFLNQAATEVITLSGSEKEILANFSLIDGILPDGIILSKFTYDDEDKIYLLDGFSPTREQLLFFREELEKTGRFTRVNFPLSILEKEANVTFTITLRTN